MRLESAHMDKKLQLIQHLYEEADGETRLNELLEDPELKQEYQALSEAKFWLDHSKREKPSSESLQAVLALAMHSDEATPHNAASPSRSNKSSSRRTDREAVPRQRSFRKRAFGITTFVMATMITAFVGYQLFTGNNSLLAPQAQDQFIQEKSSAPQAELTDDASFADGVEARQRSNEVREEASGLLEAQRLDQEAPSVASLQPASVDTSMPDWDKVGDIMLYKQRIDMLLEQNQDIAWDETAVPLESLSTTRPANSQLRQAGSPANNN
ncbi:MAG: hypothetical protein KTR29_13895 [Rhodothermaceae bacterium]|nr:hypothetical protein [Rhodothermaceae bacterium]